MLVLDIRYCGVKLYLVLWENWDRDRQKETDRIRDSHRNGDRDRYKKGRRCKRQPQIWRQRQTETRKAETEMETVTGRNKSGEVRDNHIYGDRDRQKQGRRRNRH